MQKIFKYLFPALAFFTPLLFWTLTPNFFATPKQLLLILSVLLGLLMWTLPLLTRKPLRLPRTPLTLPLLLLILAVVLNLVFIPEARIEGLVGRGSLYLALGLLALLAGTYSKPSLNRLFLNSFIVSSTLLALHAILQLTFLHTLATLPAYMQFRSFSPVGTPLTALVVISLGLVASATWAFNTKSSEHRLFLLVTTAVQTIAAIAYLSLMLGGGELTPVIVPLRASWSIALDALKSPRSLLLGVGLANFPALFTAVKPLYLNLTPLWNILPSSSGSELLNLLTIGGIVLLTPFILFFVEFFRAVRAGVHKRSEDKTVLASIIFASLLGLFLTPASLPFVLIFFLSLGLFFPAPAESQASFSRGVGTFIFLVTLVFVTATGYYTGRVALAESRLRTAQVALANNDAQTVYQAHLDAIGYVPQMTNYLLSYSQVNLTLAAGLSQAEDLSDEQRNQISQLVNQAVNSARQAASLRPNLADTWSNLGLVYTNLVNVADGADAFAVQYYQQAIQLDPGNPTLRFQLGSLYYQLAGLVEESEDSQQQQIALLSNAAREFQTASQLKPDYANAWYNLSKTLESAGNFQGAYVAMQQVLASLDPNSPDLAVATGELEALQDKLPAASPSPSPTTSQTEPSAISEPSPLPSPIPGGPLELPEESPLPSPSLTPTPSPSSSPSPTATPSPTPEP